MRGKSRAIPRARRAAPAKRREAARAAASRDSCRVGRSYAARAAVRFRARRSITIKSPLARMMSPHSDSVGILLFGQVIDASQLPWLDTSKARVRSVLPIVPSPLRSPKEHGEPLTILTVPLNDELTLMR